MESGRAATANMAEDREHGASYGDRALLRLGAASAVAAAFIAIVGNALHPRTSASEIGDTAAYLDLVSGSDGWVAVHMVIVFGSLLFLVAQFALSRALARTPGGPLAGLALSFAVLGGAVNLVDLLIDGAAMPELARRWHDAATADQRLILHTAEAVRAIDFGLLSGIMFAFFGVPFLLFGWATAKSVAFPRWLGVTGAAGGLAIMGVGFWQVYDGVSELTYMILFPPLAALLSMWLGVVGVLLWRRMT